MASAKTLPSPLHMYPAPLEVYGVSEDFAAIPGMCIARPGNYCVRTAFRVVLGLAFNRLYSREGERNTKAQGGIQTR